MLTMRTCFQSFKNTLTVKYIISFKDKLDLPPTEYDIIDEEDWNIFVKKHLSDKFQLHM